MQLSWGQQQSNQTNFLGLHISPPKQLYSNICSRRWRITGSVIGTESSASQTILGNAATSISLSSPPFVIFVEYSIFTAKFVMENYQLHTLIGEGSFGKVYKGRRKLTGQVVAMKFIPKLGKSEAELKSLKKEIEILKSLHHENIVLMLDSIETSTEVVVITEFALVSCIGGTGTGLFWNLSLAGRVVWDHCGRQDAPWKGNPENCNPIDSVHLSHRIFRQVGSDKSDVPEPSSTSTKTVLSTATSSLRWCNYDGCWKNRRCHL